MAAINMLSATNLDGPAFNTRNRTAQHTSSEDTPSQSDAVAPDVTETPSITPISLTTYRLQALLQIKIKVYLFNIVLSYTTVSEVLYKDILLKHNIV